MIDEKTFTRINPLIRFIPHLLLCVPTGGLSKRSRINGGEIVRYRS